MHYEWAFVLGVLVALVLFVAREVRRTDKPKGAGSWDERPRPNNALFESQPPAAPDPAPSAATEPETPLHSHPEIVHRFHARVLTDASGAPISSENRAAWLDARRRGVTATDVGRIVKLNGTFSEQRAGLLDAKLSGREGPFLRAFQHGIDREPVIATWVAENFGIQPNSLLCRGDKPRHLATPDGIGAGIVAEIKTSTRPLDQTLGSYRDQLQWQLHVTKSERLLFVVENRDSFQRETRWIERDEYRIFILAQHADAFILEMDERQAAATTTPESSSRRLPTNLALSPPEAPKHVSLPRPPMPAPTTALASVTTFAADVDETRSWSDGERKKLVAGYVRRATIADLAATVGTTHRAVVFELSRLLLEPEGQMVSPTAGRFGSYWGSEEEQALRDLYSAGISLPGIARRLQRDQLGTAFRLFENYIPQFSAEDAPPAEQLSEHRTAAHEATAELIPVTANTGPEVPEPEVSIPADLPEPCRNRPGEVPGRPAVLELPPETIVGGLDPDDDSDDNRHWSPAELDRLMLLYCHNEDIDVFDLARHFRTTSRAVVIALAFRILEPQGPLEDPLRPGREWTQRDVDTLHDLFLTGTSLARIAQATERDQLSVAFRLLGDRLPGVSGFTEDFHGV